jgi:transposase
MTEQDLSRRRRHFDSAYKLQVAKMIREQGLSLTQVCQDMDWCPARYAVGWSNWTAEVAGRPGMGKPQTAEYLRIRELEAQVRQLKSDYELSKKVSALFAREMK